MKNKYAINIIFFILITLFLFGVALALLHDINEPARLCLSNNWKGNVGWVTYSIFGSENNTIVCESYYENGGKQGLIMEDYLKFGSCYRTGDCLK